MTKPVAIPNTFATQSGNVPASQLDDDYNALANAINDTSTYGNYYTDSGAVNALRVTVVPPLTFSYTSGVWLDVLVANTNTSGTVTLNVNGMGPQNVTTLAGTVLAVGALVAGALYHLVYDGTSFRVQGLIPSSIVTTASGTFIGTLTGCTTAPTGTINWYRTGTRVTIYLPGSLMGISNSNLLTLTGLPLALQPAALPWSIPVWAVIDNGLIYAGAVNVTPSSTIQILVAQVLGTKVIYSPSSFTNSGQKGLNFGTSFTYDLA